MKTRYIFSPGEVKRKDNSIAFKSPDGWRYVPVEEVREIYFFSEVSLNTKFLDFAARAGIVLHFFNYYGHYSGTFYPKEHLLSGKLKIAQAQAFLQRRLEVARPIVIATALNLKEVLYHYYRHGKNETKEMIDWLATIDRRTQKARNVGDLLFLEGQVWMRFYEALRLILPQDFTLHRRIKRPPNNPINALISFGNTLLYTKTVTAIYQTHLDQTISFLHEPREARFSLSLDLSEAFKPIIVFKTILDLVNRRQIQASKHFVKELNMSLLNEKGKKIFIQAFEERLAQKFLHPKLKRKTSFQSAIKYDGYKLIKFLLEDHEFMPFLLARKM